MSNIILLVAISIFAIEFSNAALGRSRDISVRSSRSLQQQIDSYSEMLIKEVQVAKNTKEKLRSVKRVITRLRALEPEEGDKFFLEKNYLESLISSLEHLPTEYDFRKKDCSIFEAKFLSQFEAALIDEVQNAALKTSWSVLNSICKK
jgi:hypothetical protein